MVICDIYAEDEDVAVPVAPRQILKDQLAKAAKMGYTVKTGSELEFYLFKDSYDELAERGYRDVHPSSSYIMDYHMLQTTKDEWIIRQIRNAHAWARASRSSSPRASSARVSTRSTSPTPMPCRTPTITRSTSTA